MGGTDNEFWGPNKTKMGFEDTALALELKQMKQYSTTAELTF